MSEGECFLEFVNSDVSLKRSRFTSGAGDSNRGICFSFDHNNTAITCSVFPSPISSAKQAPNPLTANRQSQSKPVF